MIEMSVKVRPSKRDRLCRLCGEYMPREQIGVELHRMYIAGNVVNAHFHIDCWCKIVMESESLIRKEKENEHG